ncbi:MAG TPA: alkaline phosphatase D family protein, partial [Ktedonosporobacter sp.]|nr:alkaline phosphatase D family protein [Ktedonosporobacter sp.]
MISISVGPLVRTTSATSVTIWAECTQACTITLQVSALQMLEEDTLPSTSSAHTVLVGGRHYAAISLGKLQPATWYTYHLDTGPHKDEEPLDTRSGEKIGHHDTSPQLHCFRTMDAPEPEQGFSQESPSHLRIAYGSCHKSEEPEADALSAFGSWLRTNYAQREEQWPRLLLLIGDQIYADQPPAALKQVYPHLEQGASSFEDFALLYEYTWTKNEDIRQALAVLPTYMIFDDHEITDGWNISPTWRATAIQQGLEQMLVDGLVAYWVYQGWGNIDRRTQSDHSPLLIIMQEAEQHGEDILEVLREQIKQEIYGKADLHWHYTIPTTPPLFVTNARSTRTSIFNNSEQERDAPTQIMSQQQMNELRAWVQAHSTGPLLLVSSVPILLPP